MISRFIGQQTLFTNSRRLISTLLAIGSILLTIALVFLQANVPGLRTVIVNITLAFLAGVVIVTEKPAASLIAFMAVAFFLPFEWSASESVTINGIVFAIPFFMILWSIRTLRTRSRVVFHRGTMLPMFIFLVAAALSLLYGNATWESSFPKPSNLFLIQLGQWSIFALSFLAFFLTAQESLKSLEWLVWGFIILGAATLISRYGGLLGQIPGSIISPIIQSNGTFYVWLTAFAGGMAIFNENLDKKVRTGLFLLAASVPFLGFVFNTDWSTSWLPPLIVLAILIMLKSKRTALILGLIFMIAVIALSGILLEVFDWEIERRYSIGGRFILWEAVLRLAYQQPILGLGLTTYHQYYNFIPLLTDVGAWYQPNVNSHNLFIDIFAQMGVVGIAVFLWLILGFVNLFRSLRILPKVDFRGAYINSCIAGGIAILFASVIVEWLFPFVYNVGFQGFRVSVFSWIFMGGLVIISALVRGDDSAV